jgi:predicted nucleotidyltransferase
MKYGLSEEQLKQIQDIISSFDEIEEAILFGSRAIDTYKEASDVDIAIKGKKVTASLAAKLKYRFEEDTYLPFFFDFVAYLHWRKKKRTKKGSNSPTPPG